MGDADKISKSFAVLRPVSTDDRECCPLPHCETCTAYRPLKVDHVIIVDLVNLTESGSEVPLGDPGGKPYFKIIICTEGGGGDDQDDEDIICYVNDELKSNFVESNTNLNVAGWWWEVYGVHFCDKDTAMLRAYTKRWMKDHMDAGAAES